MLTAVYIIFGLVAGGCLIMFVTSAMTARPSDIGVVDGKLAAVPESPNCVSTMAQDEQHSIAPLSFSGSQAEAMRKLRAIVAGMPGATIVEERDTYLYAEFRSRLFRFVDDVEFLIDEEAEVIHFRSASRVGHSDLGVNRARMEQIRLLMQQGTAETE